MDPKRLLKEGADDFERELLRSAQTDAIPLHSRHAILGALGVGAVAPPALIALETLTEASPNPVPLGSPHHTVPPTPPIAPTATAPTTGAAATAGAKAAAVAVKSAVVAAVGAATIWAGTTLTQPESQSHDPVPAQQTQGVTPAAPSTVETAVGESPAPEAEVAKPKPKRAAAPNRRAESTDPLVRELSLIDSARRALRANKPSLALKRLDTYNAAFPKGSLRTEQTVLRIEALAASGNQSAANRLGSSFLKRSPNGPYARRVRSLLGDAAEDGKKR